MRRIKQKKAVELTLQTVVIFIIVLVVLVIMIYFFSDKYVSNCDTINTIGGEAINQARNSS